VYLEKDKKRKAMDYFQKALEIGMETDTLNLIGDSHRKIGLTYFYLNDDSLAMINFRMAEADYTAKSNKNYQIQLYTQMAALFHSKSDFKSEEKYLQKALVIANKQGYIKHEIDILGDLVLLPDWILAKIEQIELYTKLDLLHQTRFETEMKKTLIRSELKLDLEKYKRNLIRKEAEKTQAVFARNVSIAIGILLVLLLAALFNRYQYKKRSYAIMLTQKDEIHFQKMKVENLNSEASKRALKYEIDLKKRELVLNATFLQQKK
jgi:tetratricopeptide (TPR) repeat protein